MNETVNPEVEVKDQTATEVEADLTNEITNLDGKDASGKSAEEIAADLTKDIENTSNPKLEDDKE